MIHSGSTFIVSCWNSYMSKTYTFLEIIDICNCWYTSDPSVNPCMSKNKQSLIHLGSTFIVSYWIIWSESDLDPYLVQHGLQLCQIIGYTFSKSDLDPHSLSMSCLHVNTSFTDTFWIHLVSDTSRIHICCQLLKQSDLIHYGTTFTCLQANTSFTVSYWIIWSESDLDPHLMSVFDRYSDPSEIHMSKNSLFCTFLEITHYLQFQYNSIWYISDPSKYIHVQK